MTTVLLVHGTGVRQPAYGTVFQRFAERLAEIRPGDTIGECYWGGSQGSRLNAKGLSIPSGESDRGPDEVPAIDDEDVEVALWGLLEHDPLFELRQVSGDHLISDLPPNAAPPGQELAAAGRRLPASAEVRSRATAAGLADVLAAAVSTIVDSAAAQEALRQEEALGGELRIALARAIVAEALRHADAQLGGAVPVDGALRDALVAAIVAELGGSDRGVGAGLGRLGVNLALMLGATRPIERRRVAITEASAPAAGDVLLYLARGDGIRDFIADTISDVDGPVVVVAHSLGGIASLELLATRRLANVELLVTVGSQAPFLYELNALPLLPYGAELPDTVPRWVNVFDRRDLLSYTGERIFPGRVVDREVDNRSPFPRSHSAYFASKRFYAVLDEVLP